MFHDERFPASLSFGSMGGPERRTEVVTLANGFEERNTPWAQSRRRFDAGLALRSLDDVEVLIAFFEARRGRLYGFRWKDWADYKSSPASRAPDYRDQVIGIGDGVTRDWQLTKSYGSGPGLYRRDIRKPVAGTVTVGLLGEPVQEGIHFEVDPATGVVRFDHPPEVRVEISAGFEFDVPVRFDTDQIQLSLASFKAGEVPRVPVVEIRL